MLRQLLALAAFAGLSSFQQPHAPLQALPSRIAFGSCGHQDAPQPVLDIARSKKPDMFVWLGDNIYGDTKDMAELKAKYALLGAKPEFQRLKKATKFYATWDDHDYGWNDSGRHYPFKKESKEIFMEFWEEPKNSLRRRHEGIYQAEYFSDGKRTVQLILLDNRTFRDDLRLYNDEFKGNDDWFYRPDYYPHQTPDSTLLGETQWRWLENELRKPADLRIIASGSQFGIEYNGYEAWANFPHEQKRMLETIQKTRASGVLFITGDVHYAEISKLEEPGLYPIYDVTASGITSTWLFATANKNRIEGPVMDNHFGMITVDWTKKDPPVKMEIYDVRGNQRVEYTIRLSEISFKG